MEILGEVLEMDKKAVAIVGSRFATTKGLKTAYDFAYYLAANGITIVSGLAYGIDTIAHKAALDANGRTIAVLGSGVDVIYPPENKELAQKIIKSGAVVSNFPNGTKPIGKNFLERNRLIASLSKAVLVVEGKARSGTLSTAAAAGSLGIEVFAIAGSEATDWLIAEGVTAVASPKDVLEYINNNF